MRTQEIFKRKVIFNGLNDCVLHSNFIRLASFMVRPTFQRGTLMFFMFFNVKAECTNTQMEIHVRGSVWPNSVTKFREFQWSLLENLLLYKLYHLFLYYLSGLIYV